MLRLLILNLVLDQFQNLVLVSPLKRVRQCQNACGHIIPNPFTRRAHHFMGSRDWLTRPLPTPFLENRAALRAHSGLAGFAAGHVGIVNLLLDQPVLTAASGYITIFTTHRFTPFPVSSK